jgi:hypothetical protein
MGYASRSVFKWPDFFITTGFSNVQRPTLNFQRPMGCDLEGCAGLGFFCGRMGKFLMGSALADGETRVGADRDAGEF